MSAGTARTMANVPPALQSLCVSVAKISDKTRWVFVQIACVDGATVHQLRDAIVADDLPQVRAMLKVRPELAHASIELQMLHYAVFNRSPEMVRLLMRHGAPARHGSDRADVGKGPEAAFAGHSGNPP